MKIKDENGIFVLEVALLPAYYTQAKTIPQLLERIVEVSEGSIELLQDINKKNLKDKFTFSLKVDCA